MKTENALKVLQSRGFVAQCTDDSALEQLFDQGVVTSYIGYDPTASSLHVGNLMTVMALMHMRRCGHRIIVLIGGGTARVGDPSGKTEMRQMMTEQIIDENANGIEAQLRRLLDSPAGGEGELLVENNATWLLNWSYIDFLRDIGRHFSVNRMLSFEAYKQRLERGLSFLEFNYQLLQAYDFVELSRRHRCRLQMGGDDQWGNIVAGIDLARRLSEPPVYGLTFPLVTTSTGAKMGKTAQGAVWLDPERLSAYDYYQFWVNTDDADVVKFLKYFTFLPVEQIEAVGLLEGAELNQAKTILAYEATALLHGQEHAGQAHQAAHAAFGSRALPTLLLPDSTVPRAIQSDVTQVPTTSLTFQVVDEGQKLIHWMAEVGLTTSNKEARRLVQQGAVKLNEQKVTDPDLLLQTEHFVDGAVLLRAGKKKVHRLQLTTDA